MASTLAMCLLLAASELDCQNHSKTCEAKHKRTNNNVTLLGFFLDDRSIVQVAADHLDPRISCDDLARLLRASDQRCNFILGVSIV